MLAPLDEDLPETLRISPMFEAASAKYGWLNRVIAIGIGQRRAVGPIYSVFEVL